MTAKASRRAASGHAAADREGREDARRKRALAPLLRAWLIRYWGPNCKEFNAGCGRCRAYYYAGYLLGRDRRAAPAEVALLMNLESRGGDRIGRFVHNAIKGRLAVEDKALIGEEVAHALYTWKDGKLVNALFDHGRIVAPPLPPRTRYKTKQAWIAAMIRDARRMREGREHVFRHKDVFRGR